MIEQGEKKKEKYGKRVNKLLEENGCNDEDSLKQLISKLYRALIRKNDINKDLTAEIKRKD